METGAQKLEQPWKSVSDSFGQSRASDKDIFYGAAIGEKMTNPGSAGEVNVTILYDTGDYDNESANWCPNTVTNISCGQAIHVKQRNKLYELIVLSRELMDSVLVIQATGKNACPFIRHIFDETLARGSRNL
ncbi:hypothetical protein N7520_003986 [Penicillium odoratum]|uniref:uncharacterized protein n=1 Tax=Penicillium odoratum TaxID=1167516 RepID=UPI002547A876|nr:uncharacterized protein N7520_003986 [Penicillium odoratum]KAJ5769427.1 hypothetical protein N7520_003986 [Penicillium odoratum]